ncbi:FtsW/RodA/SpoVE family cell cycle protein [Heyndrickxia sp. NPDC080065]|uniref:FtsW/RodA/SpoVE family cell cycle protein n=1 Tax=Heyndrickxia sp. NPDC080065 TaxID=3390568 RepID=UPI003D02E634
MKNRRSSFLNEVTEQIHSKEAKKYVTDELSYHLNEVKKALMGKGLAEDEAEEKAIEQMGNPLILGQQLNKLHRPKVDWLMVILLTTTLCLGFLPLISLSEMDVKRLLIMKVIFVLFGGAAALGIMMMDYRKWKKQGWLFYTIGTLILLMIRYFSNGIPTLIRIGPITIENLMAIPFFFLAWASFFDNRRLKVWHIAVLFLPSAYLFFSVPSISTVYIYIVMVFVMMWWSKLSRKRILTISALAVGTCVISGLMFWQVLKIHQKDRMLAFFNPEKYANSAGYMVLRAKELISKAGWFGNFSNKEMIPDSHTNFVMVNFTYYYGWLFAIALLIILSLFIARIVVVISRVKDPYGKLLLIGALALYAVQLISNIGMMLGFFPITTMPLPFISYGMMPILLNAILIGVILSVYRRKDLLSSHLILDGK